MPCEDGSHLIILNSEYDREKKNIELPIEEFLSIIKGVESNYSTTLARDVAERILEIKNDRKKEQAYMTMEELLQDERNEGIAQGRAEGLAQGLSDALKVLGVSREEYERKLAEKKSAEDNA